MRVDNYLMNEKLATNNGYRRINQVIIDRGTETTYVYRAGLSRPEVYTFKETPEPVLIWTLAHEMIPQGKDKTVIRDWRDAQWGTKGVHENVDDRG